MDDQTSICTQGFKPTATCYAILAGLVIYFLIAITAIVVVGLDIFEFIAKRQLFKAHIMCGGIGMLASSMFMIRKYYKAMESMGESPDSTQPQPATALGSLVLYLSRPAFGTVLGASVYMLGYIGIHKVVRGDSIELSQSGMMVLYALAAVAGFAVTHLLDRMSAIAERIFGSKS